MNHLRNFTTLRNRYVALRHGHSIANHRGIIVSHPDNGLDDYGLSEKGILQVEQNLSGRPDLGANTLILSSDFRRARESAEIAQEMLQCLRPLQTEARLRERFFGDYELGCNRAYDEIWREDERDADSNKRGVESANQVMARVSLLIRELESRIADATILLVSHGDALQILQAAFHKIDACRHRQLEHLDTAEIRPMTLAGDSKN